jgi:hypothetical protein
MCCWKHGYASEACLPRPPAGPAPTALFVVLVRTPYSWLPSLWLTPYDTPGGQGSFSDFLAKPFPHVSAKLAHDRSCHASVDAICGPIPDLHRRRACYGHQTLPPPSPPPIASTADSLEPPPDNVRRPHGRPAAHRSPVALWAAKTASYLALSAESRFVITDEMLFDRRQLAASLRRLCTTGRSLGISGGRGCFDLQLPLIPQLPPGVEAVDAKWRGLFTTDGYDAEARHVVRQAWMAFYTQEDLDVVNRELRRTGALGLLRELRLSPVDTLTGPTEHCGASANCTARRFGGCAARCVSRNS